jgi:hypothetical protein
MGKQVIFGKSLALTGVLGGLAIAIIVPFLAFIAAGSGVIPSGGAIAITIIAVLSGAPIVLVSAFFGIVIPSSVEKSDDGGRDKRENTARVNGDAGRGV